MKCKGWVVTGWSVKVGATLVVWFSVLPYGQKNSKLAIFFQPYDNAMSFIVKIHH